MLQHTAGSDGRQWRHQLEDERIGRHFHLLAYDLLDHPEINNGYKSDLMIGITSPKAPEALRREVGWCYSQGAPRVFRGDELWIALPRAVP